MIKTLLARLKQGYKTAPFPPKKDVLPGGFLGKPVIAFAQCLENCAVCKAVCPVQAIGSQKAALTLDLGKCIFCGACQVSCPEKAIEFSREYRLAVCRQDDLIIRSAVEAQGEKVKKRIKNIFGRSLKLRQVSAGGCNACELDINVLNTLNFDLGRFGIQFVASPRHADGIVVTGPVTKNMLVALQKTYDAVPSPKLVIAVGSCAISGGLYAGHSETLGGVSALLPVDLYIPGCPPHPLTILAGLLKSIGRLNY